LTLREPARGVENTLLAELSGADYAPVRDERGVVVTLRGTFAQDGKLSPPAASTLQALGRVAVNHAEFPVLVVLHRARAGSAERDQPRLDAVLTPLKQAGASRIEAAWAGDAAPIVEPGRPEANERNERVEVVFVAPSSG
jgi:outer membrane protein OmpA-like peptidoglycan-associated protein